MINRIGRIIKEDVFAAASRLLLSSPRSHEDKVVFCVDSGKGYRCNPKYIAEEIHRRGLPLDLVWLVKDGEERTLPDFVRPVSYGSWAEVRELASASVWVDNGRRRRSVRKAPGQYYIQVWHGAISPKKIEKDAEAKLSKRYVRFAKADAADTDIMFANNSLYERVFRESFWFEGPVIRCGMPRNEPLVRPSEEARHRVRESLGMANGEKLCLYAPTFRADCGLDVYDFDYGKCCDALEGRFGGSFRFAMRLHPGISHLAPNLASKGVLDATSYCDTQELLSAVDVLISDYSSIAEDFLLTGRPCFVYAPDLDSYLNERGLYYSLEERPFPVAKGEGELIGRIEGFSEEKYAEDVRAFLDRFDIRDDGLGAQVIVDLIEQALEGRRL